MGLFIRKPFEALQAEANASGKKTLKRVLGPWSLVALGVGVIIGAGLFSITGTVAAAIRDRPSHCPLPLPHWDAASPDYVMRNLHP